MAPKDSTEVTPELLLHAYTMGIFPMSEGGDQSPIFWVDPQRRGIIPLEGFHVSRSLAKRIRQGGFTVTINTDFMGVLEACADRPDTWINREIFHLYMALYHAGYAHSLEVWHDGRLTGGVYGVSLGGAFFGESMFSRQRDASKIALFFLVERLKHGGFTLFDTQFLTDHLASLGAIEISRADYHHSLEQALHQDGDFWRQSVAAGAASGYLHRNTQTS